MTQTTQNTQTNESVVEKGAAARVGDSVKATAGKVGESTRSAAHKVSESTRSAAGKVSEKTRSTASWVGDSVKSAGETIKAHPYKTAAAVGGVAAAAAGAVVGKKQYDKRKAAREAIDDIGTPEMRAGEPEVKSKGKKKKSKA